MPVMLLIVEGLFGTVGIPSVVVVVVSVIFVACETTGVDAAAELLTSQGFGGDGIEKKEKNRKQDKNKIK